LLGEISSLGKRVLIALLKISTEFGNHCIEIIASGKENFVCLAEGSV
jgi:hypothetical protein